MLTTKREVLLGLNRIEQKVLANLRSTLSTKDFEQSMIMQTVEDLVNRGEDPAIISEKIEQVVSFHSEKKELVAALTVFKDAFLPVKKTILEFLPTDIELSKLSELEKLNEKLYEDLQTKTKKINSGNTNHNLKNIIDFSLVNLHLTLPTSTIINIKGLNNEINQYNDEMQGLINKKNVATTHEELFLSENDLKNLTIARREIQRVSDYIVDLNNRVKALQKIQADYLILSEKLKPLENKKNQLQTEKEEIIYSNNRLLDGAIKINTKNFFSSEIQNIEKIKNGIFSIPDLKIIKEVDSCSEPDLDEVGHSLRDKGLRLDDLNHFMAIIKGISTNLNENSEKESHLLYDQLLEIVKVHRETITNIANSLDNSSKSIANYQKILENLVKTHGVSFRDIFLSGVKSFNPSSIPTIEELNQTPLGEDAITEINKLNSFKIKADHCLERYKIREEELEAIEQAGKLFAEINCNQSVLVKGHLDSHLQQKFENEVRIQLMKKEFKHVNEEAKNIYKKTFGRYKVLSDIHQVCLSYRIDHLKKQSHYEESLPRAALVKIDGDIKKVELAHKIRINDNLINTITRGTNSELMIQNIKTQMVNPNTRKILTANRDQRGVLLFQSILHILTGGLMFAVTFCRKGTMMFWKPHSAVMKGKIDRSLKDYDNKLAKETPGASRKPR